MEPEIDTSYYMLRELRSFNLSNRRHPNRLDEYAYHYTVYNSYGEVVSGFEDYFPKINTTGNYPRRPENGFAIAAQLVFIADEVTYFQKPPLEFLPYRKQFFPKWLPWLVDLSYKATEYKYTKGKAVAFAYLAESIDDYHKRKSIYQTTHSIVYNENWKKYYLSTNVFLLNTLNPQIDK